MRKARNLCPISKSSGLGRRFLILPGLGPAIESTPNFPDAQRPAVEGLRCGTVGFSNSQYFQQICLFCSESTYAAWNLAFAYDPW
jgi:hypothetical protein